VSERVKERDREVEREILMEKEYVYLLCVCVCVFVCLRVRKTVSSRYGIPTCRLHDKLFKCSTYNELTEVVRECQRCRDADGQGEDKDDDFEDEELEGRTEPATTAVTGVSCAVADADTAVGIHLSSGIDHDSDRLIIVSSVEDSEPRLSGAPTPFFRKPRKRMKL
jgi:hypothetical protein